MKVIFNSFLLTYAIKTAIFGHYPEPHPQVQFFFPTQTYFSWPTGKNLKAFVHLLQKNDRKWCRRRTFLLKKTQKWAKNHQ